MSNGYIDEFAQKYGFYFKDDKTHRKLSHVPKLPANIVYVRVPKTGSSTLTCILNRAGRRHKLANIYEHNNHKWISDEPGIWSDHGSFFDLQDKIGQLKKPAIFITLLREPSQRCLSQFNHFQRFEDAVPNTTENKIKFLKRIAKILCFNISMGQILIQILFFGT
eukprot:UN23365